MRQIVRQEVKLRGFRRPIQLWLPWLSDNLAGPERQRDAYRAMQEWRGEPKVWLLPDLKEPVRWHEEMGKLRFRVLALPAEHIDRLDVFHIGSNGEVWGHASGLRFPNGLGGLLDIWLDLYSLGGGLTFHQAPESVTFAVPEVTKDGVRYRDSEFWLAPGPTWPIVAVDENTRLVTMKWPPDDRNTTPVSPEAESAEYYGPLKRADLDGFPGAVSQRNPDFRSLHVICVLPTPLEHLAPYGAGMDTTVGQAKMAEIARRSVADLRGALQKAKEAAGLYVTEAQTTQELAWLLPTLQKEGVERGLQAAWFHFNLKDYRTLREAMNSPAWREEITKSVPVRRAWGILGLFWSLLLDRLERGEKFDTCNKCGRTISARKRKRFCGQHDNRDCYRRRRAADRQRERVNRKSL